MISIDLILLLLCALALVACVLLALRSGGGRGDPAARAQLDALTGRVAELQGALLAGVTGMREEAGTSGRLAREDAARGFDALGRALAETLATLGAAQGERLDALGRGFSNGRIEGEAQAKGLREELTRSFDTLATGLGTRMGEQGVEQGRRLDAFATQLGEHRRGAGEDAQALRREVAGTLEALATRLVASLDTGQRKQGEGLEAVTGATRELTAAHTRAQVEHRDALVAALKEVNDANERRGEALRQTVEARLDAVRAENAAKLEEMRRTVDEKLQGTLEARLGASFTTVNENLERVFRSVGEMQQIATGVGDLKRVLTNVKLRGSYGETALGMLLEQVMTPEQYGQNVEVRPGSGCRVEYAIRLPGDGDQPLWLPIDVKLPREDYERLTDAAERGDAAAVEEATRGLERTVRRCAADIRDKYVEPPHSTDFGIMFLPTEGLFAEVTRRPGLLEALQRECRVVVAGPTTLMATLVSLRMGFRSLAIQKRSGEVWQVLGAVKTEFGKFGDVLDKVHKKLEDAQKAVESAGPRRRAMDRKLRAVEALPEAAAQDVLAIAAGDLAAELGTDELEEAAE